MGLGWRRLVAGASGLAVAAGAGMAVPAGASALIGSGTLTYAYQGSAADGCAAAGLCATSGTVSLAIDGGNDGPEAPKGPPVLLIGFKQTVSDTDSAAGTTCAEPNAAEDADRESEFRIGNFTGIGSVTLAEPSADGAVVEYPQSAFGLPGGSRCAGPVPADLARLPITVTRTGDASDPSFTLALSGSTTAGPFTLAGSGSAELTPGPDEFEIDSLTGPGPSGRGLPFTYEQAALAYRPVASTAPITARFSSAAGAFCTPLASCGTTGTIVLSVLGSAAPSRVTLTRVAFRHATRARALADLRTGRLIGSGSGPVQIGVTETLSRDGAVICHDTRSETMTLTYASTSTHGEVISLDAPESQFFDATGALRTYCPGPADADLLQDAAIFPADDDADTVAQGIVPLTTFAGPSPQAQLARRGSFTGPQYTGSWSGALRFVLRRTGLAVTIQHGDYQEPGTDLIPKGDT